MGETARTLLSSGPPLKCHHDTWEDPSLLRPSFPFCTPIVLLTWLNCSNCYIHSFGLSSTHGIDHSLPFSLFLFLLFGLFVHGFSRALHLVAFHFLSLCFLLLASQLSQSFLGSIARPALVGFFVGFDLFDRVRFGFGMAMVCVNIPQNKRDMWWLSCLSSPTSSSSCPGLRAKVIPICWNSGSMGKEHQHPPPLVGGLLASSLAFRSLSPF